jgi:hypothetical protein
MLSMFMNRQDANAAADGMSQDTVRRYYNAAAMHHNRRMMAIKESDAAVAFEDEIAEKESIIHSLLADRNALLSVVGQLVDMNDPNKREKINWMKSRRMDAEFDKMIRQGVLKDDPRSNPAWVADFEYIPRGK